MKKFIIWVLFIIIIAGALYIFFPMIKNYSTKLVEKTEFLKKDLTPVKIKILSVNNNKINFMINIYNSRGDLISSQVNEIKGKELFLDFIVVKRDGDSLFFPEKIYSDSIPSSSGLDLTLFYESGGKPSIYAYSDEYKKISEIYSEVKKHRQDKEAKLVYGVAIHNITEIKEIKEDDYLFFLVKPSSGGIELQRK